MVSLGVLAVALSAIVAAIAFAGKRGAENSWKAKGLSIAETVVADLRGAVQNHRVESLMFRLKAPVRPAVASNQTVYFDIDGVAVGEQDEGAFFLCRVNHYPDAGLAGLTHVHTSVEWPVSAKAVGRRGTVEILTGMAVP